MDVKGKVAVVTGAASGMGLAMAQTFADSGMAVVLADIEEAALEAALADSSKNLERLPLENRFWQEWNTAKSGR